MKKVFRMENVDCANCAAKMEDKISKLDGVNNVSINFMTTKLVIDAEDEKMEGIIDSAKAIIKKIEPDVLMKKA